MTQYSRRTLFLFSLLLIFVLAVGSLTVAQDDKTLVIGTDINVDHMDPARAFTFTSGWIHRELYNTLLQLPAVGLTPLELDVATGYEVSDDGLSYTFTIRDDVVFSDGSAMTADDVVFTFMRFINVHGNGSFLLSSVDTIEAVDDYTIRINLRESDPALINKMTFPGLGILNADVIRDAGGTDAADAETTDLAGDFFYQASAGTGPYILESYEEGVQVVLVRNENFWGEQPYFDRIIYSHVPEAATQKIALESGDIDIAADITPDQIPALEGIPGIAVSQIGGTSLHYLGMNRDPEIGGPMADPLVNLAVRYALDYEGLRMLNSPNAITPPAMVPVGFFGALPADRAFKRDLTKAKELLAEAGYPDGFEADFTYWDTTNGGVNFGTNAQKIQADLAEIGIAVNLIPTDLGGWLEPYRAGTLQMTYAIWGPDFADPANYLHFVPAVEGDVTVSNRINWVEANADPEILELRDKARVEPDPEKRAEYFAQIQVYEQEKGPWAPFLQPVVQVAYKDDIVGPVVHAFWGMIDVRRLSRTE